MGNGVRGQTRRGQRTVRVSGIEAKGFGFGESWKRAANKRPGSCENRRMQENRRMEELRRLKDKEYSDVIT